MDPGQFAERHAGLRGGPGATAVSIPSEGHGGGDDGGNSGLKPKVTILRVFF